MKEINRREFLKRSAMALSAVTIGSAGSILLDKRLDGCAQKEKQPMSARNAQKVAALLQNPACEVPRQYISNPEIITEYSVSLPLMLDNIPHEVSIRLSWLGDPQGGKTRILAVSRIPQQHDAVGYEFGDVGADGMRTDSYDLAYGVFSGETSDSVSVVRMHRSSAYGHPNHDQFVPNIERTYDLRRENELVRYGLDEAYNYTLAAIWEAHSRGEIPFPKK